MSEEAEQVAVTEEVPAPAEEKQSAPSEEQTPDPTESVPEPVSEAAPAPTEQKKTVTFDNSTLSFDEAQAEIDAIRARAGQARENLKTSHSPSPSTPYNYHSTSSNQYNASDDFPRSKNMLSHLNSHSAMLNYKVQSARSLVRKQEDLLRNLARMRENMERSECEIGKASDYYTSSRYIPRRYNHRVESASRRQVGETNSVPVADITLGLEVDNKAISEIASLSPVSNPPVSTSVDIKPISGSTHYQPDEDFEREMAAIRRRVADLTKKANEVTTPRYNAYDYLYETPSLTSTYLRDYNYDLYKVPESQYEVKHSISPDRARTTYSHNPSTYTPEYTPSYVEDVSLYPDTTYTAYPLNSYSNYIMDSLNEYPYNNTSSPDIYQPYSYDSYIPGDSTYVTY